MVKKGFKHSKETKEKISRLLEGKHNSPNTEFEKGHKHSNEIIEKLSEIQKGRKVSLKTRIKISNSHKGLVSPMKGKKHSKETIQKMNGRTPWNYIDGRSKFLGPARYGDDWEAIRIFIYKRDNFTCQECRDKMSEFPFHVHHKVPFLISFDNSLKNLITLCPSCHRKIESKIMKQLKLQKVEV